jgi:putative glutamine amidotransferase
VSYVPLIAVAAARLEPGRVRRWPDGGYGVPAPYLASLRTAGCRTAIVSPGEVAAADVLEPFDGLLLVGGGDVDPARYDAHPGQHDYGIDPERDAF